MNLENEFGEHTYLNTTTGDDAAAVQAAGAEPGGFASPVNQEQAERCYVVAF